MPQDETTEERKYAVLYLAKTQEQAEVLQAFVDMLAAATEDGGRKRAAGTKPNWKVDSSHTKAIFSHLGKWVNYEGMDPDSGAHPLVHVAWRALAVAWQETEGAEVRDLQEAISGHYH